MYTLILVYSLKSIYNQNIDSIVVPSLQTKTICIEIGKELTRNLKSLNSEIETVITCEG